MRDVQTLKVQVNSFAAELRNLKEIEAKYKEENDEIQRNINEETRANTEFSVQIKEFELQIRQKEAHLQEFSRELEGSRLAKQSLTENNHKQQTEINQMNSHIQLMTSQNDELAREID